MAKRQKKTTKAQYEELLTYVKNNRMLLNGKTKPMEVHIVRRLWQNFANKMASSGGPPKTAQQWKKIFTEWKVNIRRKKRLIQEETCKTEGAPILQRTLNEQEERLINLISDHSGYITLRDPLCLRADVIDKQEEMFSDNQPYTEVLPVDANFKPEEVLAGAINNFTEVYKIKAEAEMLRARAEYAKAKCIHFQTFGNLDNFG